MARFNEREAYENGFARIFDTEIAPRLGEMEVQRQALKRERMVKLAVSLAIGAAILAAALVFPGNGFALVVGIFALVGIPMFLVGSPTKKFRDKLRELIIPPVTRFLEVTYSRAVPESFGLSRFINRHIVGSYTRGSSHVQDHVTGTHKGRAYEMAEAHLTRKSGKNTVTVFHGLLLSIDWPNAAGAEVLIGRDYGKLLNKIAGLGKSERVTFDDDTFEKRYEVYANDPTKARLLMTPTFLQSMLAIADGRKGERPTAAFTEGRFLLALPLPGLDLFEPGSLSRSMDGFEDDMHTLLRQLTIPRRVIEILQGSRHQII